MTKIKVLLLASLTLLPGMLNAEEKKDSTVFTTIIENPITSVKNQYRSGTCWAFSSLGFLESEILRKSREHVVPGAFDGLQGKRDSRRRLRRLSGRAA